MGRFFNDPVEQALTYIYYDLRSGMGAKGFALLEEASFLGDGDASCVLSQCLRGPKYVWSGHRFPKDDLRVHKLLHQSVAQNSALGVLVAMHSGNLPEMPLTDLQNAFHIVLQKAKDGEPFCQYVIGNVYLGWGFMLIEGKTQASFAGEAEFNLYMNEHIIQCEDWFWRSFRSGMFLAANDLSRYYTEGDTPYVLPTPEKAKDLWRIGAEIGYPPHQYLWADELEKTGKPDEALRWYKTAARNGEPGVWYHVGRFYEKGIGVPQDFHYAINCYETGEKQGDINCYKPLDALLGKRR